MWSALAVRMCRELWQRYWDILSAEGVFIEYMYSFANNNVANVVIRPSNMDKCIEVLKEKKVDLLAASDLYKL